MKRQAHQAYIKVGLFLLKNNLLMYTTLPRDLDSDPGDAIVEGHTNGFMCVLQ